MAMHGASLQYPLDVAARYALNGLPRGRPSFIGTTHSFVLRHGRRLWFPHWVGNSAPVAEAGRWDLKPCAMCDLIVQQVALTVTWATMSIEDCKSCGR